MYFPDLTLTESVPTAKYPYYEKRVGYLAAPHPFPKGPTSPGLLEKLLDLCATTTIHFGGAHQCQFCIHPMYMVPVPHNGRKILLGGSDLLVRGDDDVVYLAPSLIYHYIQAHQYLPPREFIRAVMRTTPEEQIALIDQRWDFEEDVSNSD